MSKRTRIIVRIVIVLAIIAGILYAGYYFVTKYRIDPDKIYVEGNSHYSNDEIQGMVLGGMLGDNSIYLSFKYKNKKITDVPFVDAISVSVLSNDSIKISVYEKALAGYVCYLDHYIYFDKDGYVVESSNILTPGIPQVTGITFNSVEVGKKLGTGETDIFERTLDLTKLLDKYELKVDRIYFHDGGRVTLYFGTVRVNLGSETTHIEDKVMNLPEILSKLVGKTGVLDMEEYDETNGIYIFTMDE
ncbi:MAG: cell division protein FtsQ/DivIB [Lachnospiraceae bacterium]|nr:cell division protein FtsQ/DivIB [Lachnospiraceae bacterium]